MSRPNPFSQASLEPEMLPLFRCCLQSFSHDQCVPPAHQKLAQRSGHVVRKTNGSWGNALEMFFVFWPESLRAPE